ncbi:putative Sulfatase [Legionella busanensis]|uniref:Putative Sulfatase n=1 Tax=Legionella busanensis TaxID=190655 RepID=A0A378JQF0_9GAMM|nr:sulfatase-like hydrolase/transferase [Legionella busanensis]STX50352.1 putative Sulfatase [Legionella busanensis]
MTKPFQFKKHLNDFFIYNLVFIFLQFLFIFKKSSSFIQAVIYPLTVYIELLAVLFIQLLLYVFLSLLQTSLLWGVARSSSNKKIIENWEIIIYTLTLTALITLNCYFFPLSKFSRIFLPEFPASFLNILMVGSLIVLTILSFIALIQFLYKYPWWGALLAIIIFLFGFSQISPKQTNLTNKRPNLIIIGIDSLNPNQISKQSTPNLYKFLHESVYFSETISPLGRTYAAWTTILTGLYPLHHHARENLYPIDSIKYMASFAWNLRQAGYQTLFATDDRRFNNLGKEFGFDKIIGPRIGVNETLIGSFYDLPLSNLLINFRLTKWLFPYNYANRAGHFAYYPRTFSLELEQTLVTQNNTKPMFLAVHFTLPHWPYAWAISSPKLVQDEFEVNNREILYKAAVNQVDQQVGRLLKFLQQNGALTNSFIILLSDHGEVLYNQGSRETDPRLYQGKSDSQFIDYIEKKTDTKLQRSSGHGTDLLSPGQHHCILGFKIVEHNKLITIPTIIPIQVALIDIAPTIANFFNLNLKEKPDGISLLNTILGKALPPPHRAIMLESGMLPNLAPAPDKVIKYVRELYQVNPITTYLEIRKDKFVKINAMKQFGIIKDNWLFALYPNDNYYIPVILQLKTGYWTDDLNSDFAKKSPALEMLKELRQFYQKDLGNYPYVQQH